MNPDHIDSLEISRTVRNVLLRAQITSITKILRMGRDRLALVNRLGIKSVEQIQAALEIQGYELTKEGGYLLPSLSTHASYAITAFNQGDSIAVRQGLANVIRWLARNNFQSCNLLKLADELDLR